MRWQDRLPPDAPKPLPRETARHYAMRMMRIADDRSIEELSRKLDKMMREEYD